MKTKDLIIESIKNNVKINRYKELEVVINSNTELLLKLDNLKDIQKQIVHAEKLGKNTMLDKLNIDYKTKMDEITNYPLMGEYLDLQTEINDMLQDFKDIIEKAIDSDFE